MLTTGRVGMTRRSWSVVQIFNLGNNTHAIAVKIFDFGNSEPWAFPTVEDSFVRTTCSRQRLVSLCPSYKITLKKI